MNKPANEVQHTPGPWSINGTFVDQLNGELSLHIECGEEMIAEVYDEANAKMMVLAPELIEENKRLKDLISQFCEFAEDVLHWGEYASEYFQEKHDLAGDIKQRDELLCAAKELIE